MHNLRPSETLVYHVFVAAPGDMGEERRGVRQFFEGFNRRVASAWSVRFEVIDWENWSNSGVGRPQELITAQTLERYKGSLALMVGLLGQRFGTPTGEFDSGTEEEFEWALKHFENTGFPEIKLFFRKVDSVTVIGDPARLREAAEQLAKLNAFKERVRPIVSFREFSAGAFEDVLRNDLELWLCEPRRDWAARKPASVAVPTIDVHADIDRACVHIREGRPDVAIVELDELRKRYSDSMQPRERFRILANLGHAHRVKRDYARAATFFLDATKYQPEDENARSLCALAEYMLGNTEEAARQASSIIKDHPRALIAIQVWVLTSPPNRSMHEILEGIPSDVRGEFEVLFALARRSLQAGDADAAEDYARRLLAKSSDDPDVQSLVAQSIIVGQGARIRGATGMPKLACDSNALDEAVGFLTKACKKYLQLGALEDAAEARTNIGIANHIRGKVDGALRDYAAAFELAPDAPEIGRRYASALVDRGNLDEAEVVLRGIHDKGQEYAVSISLAVLLAKRRRSGDVDEAIEILEALLVADAQTPAEMSRETIFILAELYALRGSVTQLESLPDSAAARILDDASRLTLLSITRLRRGDEGEATNFAKEALSVATSKTPAGSVKRLGYIFRQLHMPFEAYQALSKVIEPSYVDDDVRSLLDCAAQAGQDRYILDFCAQLRTGGILDPYCVQLEVNALVRYHAERQALGVLDELLASGLDEELAKQVRVEASLIALRIGSLDRVTTDAARLPLPDKAPATIGAKVVEILVRVDRLERSSKYAYGLFRFNANEPAAHMAVIRSLGLGTHREIDLPSYDSVQPGTGIVFQTEGEAGYDWRIIEDEFSPLRMLNELSPDDPFAGELLGKLVGDWVVTNPGGMQERHAQIKEIHHKYVRRFQDCLSHWEARFPQIPFVWRVDVKTKDDGIPDFREVFRSLDLKADRVEKLTSLYKQQPVPLHMFASGVHGRLPEAVQYLSGCDGAKIWCCNGDGQERDQARRALGAANAIILDATALATLFVLNEAGFLRAIPIRLVVPVSAIDGYRNWLEELQSRGTEHHAMAKVGNDYVFSSIPATQVHEYLARIETFIQTVKDACQLEPGVGLADIPAPERQRLVELFGTDGAEAIAISRGEKRILWTDDQHLGQIASKSFGVMRVWTQAVAAWFADRGTIPLQSADDLSLKLLVQRYFFTSVRAPMVLRSAQLSQWNPDSEPLRSVVYHLSMEGVDDKDVLFLVGHSLVLLWRNAVSQASVTRITHAFLEAISNRKHGKFILAGLRKHLTSFFGLDVVNARKAEESFDEWREGESGGLIVYP